MSSVESVESVESAVSRVVDEEDAEKIRTKDEERYGYNDVTAH